MIRGVSVGGRVVDRYSGLHILPPIVIHSALIGTAAAAGPGTATSPTVESEVRDPRVVFENFH